MFVFLVFRFGLFGFEVGLVLVLLCFFVVCFVLEFLKIFLLLWKCDIDCFPF